MIYHFLIVGAGITGLNTARLLLEKYPEKKICLTDKSKRIGGLICTQNKKPENVKYEAGPAVVYSYQKNILKLINKYKIETFDINLSKNENHVRTYFECNNDNKNCGKRLTKLHLGLFRKVFMYMDSKGKKFCRNFTFEQICHKVIGSVKTNFLEFCYGYSLDFKEANSVSARKNIENELFNSNKMYFFKKGYNELYKNLYEDIKHNLDIKLNFEFCSFHENNKIIKINFDKGKNIVKARKLILCISKDDLLKNCDSFKRNELRLFKSVVSGSLCRLFLQFDMSKRKNQWIKNVEFSAINNPLRQIIPIRKKLGIIQISYTDWHYADYWGNLPENQWVSLVKIFFKEVFNKDIDDPIWQKRYYFKNAIHCWKPGVNETLMYKKIMNLRKNVFIAGESYSKIQGWCEGAILSSIDLVKNI